MTRRPEQPATTRERIVETHPWPDTFPALAGAASLLFVLAPECRRLTGLAPQTEKAIQTHAELIAQLLVP